MRPCDDDPVTPEESLEASRLRHVLEGREDDSGAGADLESLAVVRLLETVSDAGRPEDLAARRLRRELVVSQGRVRRFRLAAAAAVLLAVTGLLVSRRHAPRPELLDTRERTAREALAAVTVPVSTLASVEGREEAIADSYRVALFDDILKKRTEKLLDKADETSRSRLLPSPTPGGVS